MAIRDFGSSLLSDVRKRKDAQTRSARKYARSQKNKDLIKGLVLPHVAQGLSSLIDLGNSRVAQKTNQFLANSDLYNNTVLVNNAGTIIEKSLALQNQAKEEGVSIYDIVLRNNADKTIAQKKILDPNSIKEGLDEEFRSVYMEREEHKNKALEDAKYHEKVIEQSEIYSKGKNKNTLAEISLQQKPRTMVGAMWEKLAGDETTLSVFNNQMSQMEQVLAAKNINVLTAEKLKKAGQVAASLGNLGLAKSAVGMPLSLEEIAIVKEAVKKGETIEELQPTITSGTNGIWKTKNKKITGQDGNIRIDSKTEQVFKPSEDLTPEDLNKLTGSTDKLFEIAASLYNERGTKDFVLAVSKMMDGKSTTPEDIPKLLGVLMEGKFTESKNIVGDLPAEVQAVMAGSLTDRLQNIQSSIGSGLSRLQNNPQDKEALTGVVKQTQLVNTMVYELLDKIMNPEVADVKEDLVEEAPAEEAPDEEAPADYPNAKKGSDGQWYIPDPNKAGKFLKVVGI